MMDRKWKRLQSNDEFYDRMETRLLSESKGGTSELVLDVLLAVMRLGEA